MNDLQTSFTRLKAAFTEHPHLSAATRIQHLEKLAQALLRSQETFIRTISEDFGQRSSDETRLAEILPSLEGIKYAQKRIKKWMRPSRRSVGLAFQPARAVVEYQAVGVVGIIVPWNYPLYLAISPLVAALAAGNRVLIKMSEHTPATAAAFLQMISETFDDDHVVVVVGDAAVAEAFSHLPFDHLVFTGGTSIGRAVMAAAAKNLTPVTLELGGKSPAIIGTNESPNALQAHAERIAFGKALNAGQTCVAPDYVLCPEEHIEACANFILAAWQQMYPSLHGNPDYTHIVNQKQYDRLHLALTQAEAAGARIIQHNPEQESLLGTRIFPPTLVVGAADNLTLLQEEIFGPILPLVPYRTIESAVAQINNGPRPLALYYFGYDKKETRYIIDHTRSGGVCVNDTVFQVAQDDLPFGGIGHSGMGHYHGHEGFLTLSKARSILSKGRLNSAKMIYPPYGGSLLRLIYRLFIR